MVAENKEQREIPYLESRNKNQWRKERMEWLKTILEKAVYVDGKIDMDATMKLVNAEFPKHAVPKAEFNDVNGRLKTADETIKTLKKENADNESLQKTVKEHEDTIKTMKAEHEGEMRNMHIQAEIQSVLSKNKAKHADLLASKFDLEKVVVKDGKVSGLEEQVTSMKETYKDLFEVSVSGKTPPNPESDYKSGDFNSLVTNAGDMTADEVAAQFAAMSKQQ